MREPVIEAVSELRLELQRHLDEQRALGAPSDVLQALANAVGRAWAIEHFLHGVGRG